jgi:hypothetical protein
VSEVKKHLCAAAATMKIEPEREIFCVCACVKKKKRKKIFSTQAIIFVLENSL